MGFKFRLFSKRCILIRLNFWWLPSRHKFSPKRLCTQSFQLHFHFLSGVHNICASMFKKCANLPWWIVTLSRKMCLKQKGWILSIAQCLCWQIYSLWFKTCTNLPWWIVNLIHKMCLKQKGWILITLACIICLGPESWFLIKDGSAAVVIWAESSFGADLWQADSH